MPVTGQELIARNIDRFGGGFLKHVNKTMIKVEKIIDKQVTKNISLKCHTQEDLNALSNPYARWHGSRGMHLHDPYWQIHSQSGKLLSSKKHGTEPASIGGGTLKAKAFVRLDSNITKYAQNVIYGTSKMIPRPALTMSLEQVRGKVFDTLEKNLRDMVHNFRAG